jgi:hypothetical protein
MRDSSDERRILERRLAEIAVEMRAVQRAAALDGADMTDRWDELFGQRVSLARRLVALSEDYSFTSLRSLFLLTASIAVLSVVLHRAHTSAHSGAWTAVWYVAGLLSGFYLLATRHRRFMERRIALLKQISVDWTSDGALWDDAAG